MKLDKEQNFLEHFAKYVKHQGITLELTLDDNEKVIVHKNRFLDGKELVQFYGSKEVNRIPLCKIQNAEIYI